MPIGTSKREARCRNTITLIHVRVDQPIDGDRITASSPIDVEEDLVEGGLMRLNANIIRESYPMSLRFCSAGELQMDPILV